MFANAGEKGTAGAERYGMSTVVPPEGVCRKRVKSQPDTVDKDWWALTGFITPATQQAITGKHPSFYNSFPFDCLSRITGAGWMHGAPIPVGRGNEFLKQPDGCQCWRRLFFFQVKVKRIISQSTDRPAKANQKYRQPDDGDEAMVATDSCAVEHALYGLFPVCTAFVEFTAGSPEPPLQWW